MTKLFTFLLLAIVLCLNSSCYKDDIAVLENESILNQIENEPMFSLDNYVIEKHPNDPNLVRAKVYTKCLCNTFTLEQLETFTQVSDRVFFYTENQFFSAYYYEPEFRTTYYEIGTNRCFTAKHFDPYTWDRIDGGLFCIQL